MKTSGILGTALAAVIFAAVNAHAAPLASYPFTGSSLASTDLDPASTAGNIVLGTGLTDTTRFATANGSPAPALRVNTDETAATYVGSIAAGEYFVFTLTPGVGEALDLNTLTFDLATSTAAITTNVLVQLSGDGTSYTSVGQVATFSTANVYTAESIDLSVANSNLATGAPLYVRMVVNDNTNNGVPYTGFDNITVNGTVVAAVPEPVTNAWLAAGAFGMIGGMLLRRRRAGA